MRILLLSRYGRMGASSRVRFLQYLAYFKGEGLCIDVAPLLSDNYLQALYSGENAHWEVIKGYSTRFWLLFQSKRYQLLIIEKELFPFFPAVFERILRLFNVPYLVDYDDALFHNYDHHPNVLVRLMLGRKIDAVMKNASVVVAGNPYLAERAKLAGAKSVKIIPTVIDSHCYSPALKLKKSPQIIVGWIGTVKTSNYLKSLIPVFEKLQETLPVRFVAVGANDNDFIDTPVDVWPWSEDSEVASIQQFDIGIMPLPDTPWERGKCGYKLIQYMACGIPVVASPVGVNKDIVKHGENGYWASSEEEWELMLTKMINMSKMQRRMMGVAARTQIDDWYSLHVQAPLFLSSICEAVE